MSNDDEKQPSKRGRPKKVKTEEEITLKNWKNTYTRPLSK